MTGGSGQPWPGRAWAASRHNFDPAIAVPERPVALHDLTLRDGEEAADLTFTTADKVRIAEALARLGIKRTEVSLTIPGWQEVVHAIVSRQLGVDLWVTWQPGKMEAALDLASATPWCGSASATFTSNMFSAAAASKLMDEMLSAVRAAVAAGTKMNLLCPRRRAPISGAFWRRRRLQSAKAPAP